LCLMGVSKKLQKLHYVKKITGVDTFASRFQTKKLKYIQNDIFFKSNKKKYDLVIIVDVLHHVGIDDSYIVLKKLSKISKNIKMVVGALWNRYTNWLVTAPL